MRRYIFKLSASLTVIVGFCIVATTSVSAAVCTITVTSLADSGAGTLRQSILDANSASNIDTICFNVGTGYQKILPSSSFPPVTQPLIVDGTTQPGFDTVTLKPIVEINGSNAGSGSIGLRITGNGSGSTIRGLLINRFSGNGLFIDSSNNTVAGNYIGISADGQSAAGNLGDGIGIFSGINIASANNNTIGGSVVADRNIISGNGLGTANGANGIGITARQGGIANNNAIKGNYIGTNADGTLVIANQGDGILINHDNTGGAASLVGNIIGGTVGTTPGAACTGDCNLVSGNTANGIGLWHSGVTSTVVAGNYAGTDKTGMSALPNQNIGIEINETPNNSVGGTTPAARNVFSGNGGAGVFITGAASTGNQIAGNFIGTDASGNARLANLKMGIGVGFSPGAIGANSNTIGGTTGTTPGVACAGSCNLISGNGQNGIFITGSESGGHQILGNYIGLSVSGGAAIGNSSDGIGLLDTPNTSIGNGSDNGRNIIASNGSNGVIVAGAAATGNRISKNTIGFVNFGNTASGVSVSVATDTAILSNSIFYNGLLGIDLDNNGTVNKNDERDNDIGANRIQNFPVVYAANNVGTKTFIGGQFNGSPSSSFVIEFFYSDGCNAGSPSNYGEGQYFISSININTDVYGNTAFGTSTLNQIIGNKYITATATKLIAGVPAETSEYSKCILVDVPKPALTNGANWFLKNDLTPGPSDALFGYGFPSTLLMCAWDANQPGVKLPVLYADGSWFMRASYTTGTADLNFNYGNGDHKAFCGDWDGDGVDTPGLLAIDNTWLLRNSNSGGPADAGNFTYGPAGTPIVGDWDGNGTDTVGLVANKNEWFLRNSNSSGPADAGNFTYGNIPGYFVVGDWDGNGTDTVGSVSVGGTWSIRNSNTSGPANGSFQFGFPGVIPIVW